MVAFVLKHSTTGGLREFATSEVLGVFTVPGSPCIAHVSGRRRVGGFGPEMLYR